MNRTLWLLAISLLLVACPKQQEAVRPTYSGPPKAFKLLAAAPEAETSTRAEKRQDLYVTTESGDPVPAVVAVGEVGPISRQSGRVRLYGDEAGTQGWSVDNFLLLEVLDAKGAIVQRAAVGFQQGTTCGSEHIDSLGGMKFSFEAGEVDLSGLLPSDDPFTVRATALDVGGVGKISDLYMILSSESGGASNDEDLRNE
jgi:hypothetical protein